MGFTKRSRIALPPWINEKPNIWGRVSFRVFGTALSIRQMSARAHHQLSPHARRYWKTDTLFRRLSDGQSSEHVSYTLLL
jgi:hypothetical protein